MISRKQVQQMIESYGADLARWPCDDRENVAKFIANDAALSEELLVAAQLDQKVNEFLATTEPEWSLAAKDKLITKTLSPIKERERLQPQTIQKSTWAALIERVKSSITTPIFPTAVAMLMLLSVLTLQNTEVSSHIPNVNAMYSSTELDEWLVFEGLASSYEPLAELNLAESLTPENAEAESYSNDDVFLLL